MRNIRPYIYYLLWLLMISFIFYQSLQIASVSDEKSLFFVYLLQNNLNISIDTDLLNHIIRKCAHFSEYTLLGILAIQAHKKYPINRYYPLFNYLIPIIDECIQYFVPLRSCQISDMLLYSLGISFGFIVYLTIQKYFSSHKVKH